MLLKINKTHETYAKKAQELADKIGTEHAKMLAQNASDFRKGVRHATKRGLAMRQLKILAGKK